MATSIRPLVATLAAAALAACAPAPVVTLGQTAEAPIVAARGAEIGRARLTEATRGVFIVLEFNQDALEPGQHGVHFHEHGTCEDDGFQASGSHVGHAEGGHGLLNPQGPEPGDLPSLFAPPSGGFTVELFSPFLTLGQHVRDRASILDADGAALIIHANHDDQTSQPIGGAGARVACAVFTAG
jgi:Cu-Zn family superoxide dismutase